MSASTEVRAAAPARAARTGPTRIKGSGLAFWLFFTPFLVGLLVFTILPLIWGGTLSLFEARGTVLPTKFIGLDNFRGFLVDTAFLQSLRTFIVFALFIVPVTMASSLALAVLVNGLPRFQMFFRSVFFLPTACSYVVACVVWRLSLFNGLESGVVNQVLGVLGMESVSSWLSASPYWWIVLVSVRLWSQVGFYILLFLAGLQAIPTQLYEAAAVDGLSPGGFRMFRLITLPQLRTTSAAVLLLLLIAAFQAFDEFYNLTGNNPETRPPLVYLYNIALGPRAGLRSRLGRRPGAHRDHGDRRVAADVAGGLRVRRRPARRTLRSPAQVAASARGHPAGGSAMTAQRTSSVSGAAAPGASCAMPSPPCSR
ncbi:sugar ABC transporter permease [Brachybacterium sp. GPGPB12]|uniref:carbohydrate ABC transporter permease n=1 Tax=Brachybacterium sp. GPGPB12 TaxID=3023517 RepID=UPI0031345C52